MYSGWHFTADPDGCDSLLQLLDGFVSPDTAHHRTLSVIDPRSIGVDRIFGEHELKVRHPAKLRLAFDPVVTASQLFEEADRVSLVLGAEGLPAFREAVVDLRADQADFTIGLAGKEGLSFWWWPK